MNQTVTLHFGDHLSVLEKYSEKWLSSVNSAAEEIAACFLNGGKLYICGSGISKTIAEYAASIFLTRCRMPRPPLPAVSLNASIPVVSMSGDTINDIYEKQVATLATPPDIVWGICDSRPESVIRGLRAAVQNSVRTVAFALSDDSAIQGVSDLLISVSTADPLRAQEIYLIMIHAICDRVDEIIFSTDNGQNNEDA